MELNTLSKNKAIDNLRDVSREIRQDKQGDANKLLWGSLASIFAMAALSTNETFTSAVPDFNAAGQIGGVAVIGLIVYGTLGLVNFRNKMGNIQLNLIDDLKKDIYTSATLQDKFPKFSKESFKAYAVENFNRQNKNLYLTALNKTVRSYTQKIIGLWMLGNIAIVSSVHLAENYFNLDDRSPKAEQIELKM